VVWREGIICCVFVGLERGVGVGFEDLDGDLGRMFVVCDFMSFAAFRVGSLLYLPRQELTGGRCRICKFLLGFFSK